MTLLLGALTIGLILSLLALGVFISFRIFNFADITADGSVTLGASVAAVLLVGGTSPLLATMAAFVAGMMAGVMAMSARRELGDAMPILLLEPGQDVQSSRVRAGFELLSRFAELSGQGLYWWGRWRRHRRGAKESQA